MSILQYLLHPGTLGFYRSATITSIILREKLNSQNLYHNLYTLVTMHEFSGRRINQLRWGTPKPLHLHKKKSVMIVFQDVELDTVKELYRSVTGTGKWQQPNSSAPLEVEEFTVLPPAFVPKDSHIPIHHGLKNPYRGCHYLLELFAEKKTVASSMTEKERREIAQWVMQWLPIDLGLLSDRWGNIIFQFPITLLSVHQRGDSRGTHLNVQLAWHPLIASNPPEVSVEASVRYDGLILGYGKSRGVNAWHEIELGTTSGAITTSIWRECDGLLLYQNTSSLMGKMVMEMNVLSQEKRHVSVPDKNGGAPVLEYQVSLYYKQRPIVIGQNVGWKEWIGKRQHRESVKQLERKRHFVQYYGIQGEEQRKKALADIRELVERFAENGAYLWDPYCDGIDILNTLFACRVYGAPLKVITSFSRKVKKYASEHAKRKKYTYVDWKRDIINQLKSGGNFAGINLEVRCQYGEEGWPFHDRFLLFPGEPPHVWSLGTSVNNIGKTHSILLKVEHAQPVIDVFHDLWDQLEGNIIWPPKNDI